MLYYHGIIIRFYLSISMSESRGPVEGVSFTSIKAGTKKVPKVPPPPVAPGDRDFTTTELVQFDGSDPKKPLYMSILGRVYVTWW